MVRKCRARPNPTLTADEYYGILATWLLVGPATTLQLKVGRSMTSDFRAVNAKSLAALQGLIEALVNSSPSGAVHGTRMERALAKLLADHPQLLSEGLDPEKECVRFIDHVLAHMYMVRHLASEQCDAWQGHRKYPKSGGLRKQLSTKDWCWLTPVLQKIMGDASTNPDSKLERSEPDHQTATTAKTSEPPEVEVNSEGWPTIFSSILAGETSQDSASVCGLGSGSHTDVEDSQMPSLTKASSVASFVSHHSGVSEAATEFYDEQGFPTCFGSFGQPQPPKLQTGVSISDGEVAPITPRPRKRKADAKAKAKAMSSSRKKSRVPPAEIGAKRGRPPKIDDGGKPLRDLKISGPTKGNNPKTELCAWIDGARVHVLTLTKASWGPTFDIDLRHLAQLAEEKSLTKADVIALRDDLKKVP